MFYKHAFLVVTCVLELITLKLTWHLTDIHNFLDSVRNTTIKAYPYKDIYREGDTVTLTCSALANPPAEYSWILPDGSVANGSIYQLQYLRFNDTGSYTCYAKNGLPNEHYTDSATNHLKVLGGEFIIWCFKRTVADLRFINIVDLRGVWGLVIGVFFSKQIKGTDVHQHPVYGLSVNIFKRFCIFQLLSHAYVAYFYKL